MGHCSTHAEIRSSQNFDALNMIVYLLLTKNYRENILKIFILAYSYFDKQAYYNTCIISQLSQINTVEAKCIMHRSTHHRIQ